MKLHERKYIGDGLYAEYDGFQIKITAEDGINIQHTIYLDPYVMDTLVDYIKQIKEGNDQN